MGMSTADMAKDPPSEVRALGLALFGYFNPQIFQPSWFVKNRILGDDELKGGGDILADTPGLVAFDFHDWLLEVSLERLLLYSSEAHKFPFVKDLATSALTLLRHTPVRGFALNHTTHQSLGSAEVVENLLDNFVPRAPWQRYGPQFGERRVVLGTARTDNLDGSIRIELSKSDEVDDGVYVGIIDEVTVAPEQEHPDGCAEVLQALESIWAPSIARSDEVVQIVLGDYR